MWRLDLFLSVCVSDMSYVHHPNYIRLNVTSSCCINVVSHLLGFFFILHYALCSGNCFFILPWVWVYLFVFSIQQLILSFTNHV
jgi:hypothetical protein